MTLHSTQNIEETHLNFSGSQLYNEARSSPKTSQIQNLGSVQSDPKIPQGLLNIVTVHLPDTSKVWRG